jgi:hypothetical protein
MAQAPEVQQLSKGEEKGISTDVYPLSGIFFTSRKTDIPLLLELTLTAVSKGDLGDLCIRYFHRNPWVNGCLFLILAWIIPDLFQLLIVLRLEY